MAKPEDQHDFRPEFVDDPFANCPSGGSSFPTLVRTNEGREMRTELHAGSCSTVHWARSS
ncbi:MAG: hypothetical protein M3356_03460 [Actinomycetota bacterium]|nr:hypothetical protein [Actinomycetota bacterium]